jgi:predicted acetyltransferase
MVKLVAPTAALREAWLDARDEWRREGEQQHGSGAHDTDELDSFEGFRDWVQRLTLMSDESVPVPEGIVHATYWWIVEDGQVLGSISMRHRLNDFLLRAGGHVGYSVRPSARRRGLATWALGEVLERARARGLDRVLVSCNVDNVASARTIERNGGVLDDIRDTPELGRIRRYWIDLT